MIPQEAGWEWRELRTRESEQIGLWAPSPASELEQLQFGVLLPICFLYVVLFRKKGFKVGKQPNQIISPLLLTIIITIFIMISIITITTNVYKTFYTKCLTEKPMCFSLNITFHNHQ